MNKFAKWLRDESDHHLSRGTKHPIGDNFIHSVQIAMIYAADEIDDLEVQISEPWCYEGGGQAVEGSCPTHKGDACLRTPEGLVEMIGKTQFINSLGSTDDAYDPKFGDDKSCKCRHPYYRHFDTYEDMYPCGCKYCECRTFALKMRECRHGEPDNGKECYTCAASDQADDPGPQR